jgi:VIT1/CCC1 family predicted Fe2+/Mn2+ transporter
MIERQEIIDIYKAKGFDGQELKMVVDRITSDKQVWIDTMMKDELGLSVEKKSPFRADLSTFISFVIAGAIPLIFYLLAYSGKMGVDPFLLSSIVTAFAFIVIGYIKTSVTHSSLMRNIFETVTLGGCAAYFLGDYLEKVLT